jgi:hypothetical protein
MVIRLKFLLSFCIFFIFITISIFAEPEYLPDSDVEEVLSEIKNNQNIVVNEDISPEKISSELLIKLGEAVIVQIDPDSSGRKNVIEQGAEKQMQEIYQLIGYRYIESGFELDIAEEMYNNWLQDKGAVKVDAFNSEDESESDSVGFSFTLYILGLIIIIILISVFNWLRKKAVR